MTNASAMTKGRALELSLAHALLFVIAFPPFDLWPAAFVTLIPLVVIALRSANPLRSAGVVWIVATGMWLFLQRWLLDVTVAGWPLLAMYLALYPAAFVWIGARLGQRVKSSRLLALALAALWTGLETLRGEFMLTGYAWFLMAHPLIETWMSLCAAYIGVYGIGFVLAFSQSIFLIAFLRRHKGRDAFALVGVAFGSLAVCALSGLLILARGHADDVLLSGGLSVSTNVVVVQTNVPQSNKIGWPIEQRLSDFERIRELTLDAAAGLFYGGGGHQQVDRAPDYIPDLIIWPETMFPGDTLSAQAMDEMRRAGLVYPGGVRVDFFNNELFQLQQSIATPLLVGAIGYDALQIDITDAGEIEFNHEGKYNSAFLIEDGDVADARYDKLHLTPFGEVMPIISRFDWLERMVLAIGAGGMAFDLDAGRAPVVFEVPIGQAPMDGRDARPTEDSTAHRAVTHNAVRIVTPICFEAATARVCRRLVFANGERQADLMVNLTNDGWFGDTRGGREQHLQVARWRCIELRTPMVRAANTGVSASIDTLGRVQDRGPDNREKDWNVDGVLRTGVWLPGGPPTFYARYGDIVGWACVLGAALATIVAFRPSTKDTALQTDQERTDAANSDDRP